MSHQRLCFSVAVILILVSSFATRSEGGTETIGFYTAVSGQVTVMHPPVDQVIPVKLNDEVLFKDVIQTQDHSRTKAFFQDDSILTVGESSRVEIDEYIYNPEENVRRAIVKLVQGQVRALVSKVFKANGSRFEIHTPSAVAAARGTYFTVWVRNGQSGIINIGEKGRVDFTSAGTTVAVDPGFFSVAQEGQAPSIPAPHFLGRKVDDRSGSTIEKAEATGPKVVRTHDRGQNLTKVELELVSFPDGLAQALAAVELTTLREMPLLELPAQTLQALNIDALLVRALTTLTGLTTDPLGGTSLGTAIGDSGSHLTGALISVGTTTTSSGTVSVGSLSVGSVSGVSTAPVVSPVVGTVAPVISTVVTPLAPVISPVVAPLAPVISPIVAPVAPVISPVVAPLAPVISPIVAPVAPVISPIISPLLSR